MNRFVNNRIRFIAVFSIIALAFAVGVFYIAGYGTNWLLKAGWTGEFWVGAISIIGLALLAIALIVMFHPGVHNAIGSIVAIVAALSIGGVITWLSLQASHINWGFYGLGIAVSAIIVVIAGAFVAFYFIMNTLNTLPQNQEDQHA
jgi:hypothetical protein